MRVRAGVRAVVGKLLRAVTQPLTLAQALSSASGAGAMVLAAATMAPAEFTRFSLFTLVASLALGLVGSGLLQPALIHQRTAASSLVPLRYVGLASLVVAVVFLATCLLLDVAGALSIIAICVSSAFPILYEWRRYRAIGLDQRWVVAQCDVIRFVLTFAILLVPSVTSSSVALQVYLSTATLIPILWASTRLPRLTRWESYRSYSHSAGWQLLDFLLGQSLIALPLLFLGGVAKSSSIGGVRLAQSILGPLNLVFSAASTNLVADGATRPELSSSRSLISRGTALGRMLGLLSVAVVLSILAAAYLLDLSLNGVTQSSLLLGLVLIGGSLITTGWAGVHAIVLRLLNQQATVTLGRALITVLTVSGFVIGYLVLGVDGSLICGFSTLTIASPVFFLLLAHRSYRRHRLEQPDLPAGRPEATPD